MGEHLPHRRCGSGNTCPTAGVTRFPHSLIPEFSFLCILILLLAWALRLYQLEADSLWGDEIFTAIQSPLPVLDLLRWTAGDIHPPGYYLTVGRLADWSGMVRMNPAHYAHLREWLDRAEKEGKFRWLIDPDSIDFDDCMIYQKMRAHKGQGHGHGKGQG